MSKRSAVVSGMGLGLGMLTIANEVRKELDVTDNQFHILSSEAGREYWRTLFESMVANNENRYKTYKVTVNYDKTLAEMVEAGQYDSYDKKNIKSENFSVTGSGQEDVEITLVHRCKRERSQTLIDEMDVKGYRPTTFEKVLSLGAQHPELQRKFPIITLGTVVQIDGRRRVLCLCECDVGRELGLYWFDRGWRRRCRFAFVRKNLEI